MCTINQDHMMYGSWDMKCNRRNFFVILGNFLPSYPYPQPYAHPPSPSKSPKNENFKKIKKGLEISFNTSVPKIMIISFIVPEIWSMPDIFHFGLFFALLPPNSLKKWKKSLEISSFYTSLLKIMIICYTAPEIWCRTDVIVIFHFGLFFALLPP